MESNQGIFKSILCSWIEATNCTWTMRRLQNLTPTILQFNIARQNMFFFNIHYSKKLKEHFDIMIFIERYPLKRCQGCVKLIASKVNCFLNINDLSEVQLCMSSNSWTWECPHTKDGADPVPLIFLSSACSIHLFTAPDLHLVDCDINTKKTTWLLRPIGRITF